MLGLRAWEWGAPASTHGVWMDHVYAAALAVTVVFFVLTQASLLYIGWRYRFRKDRPASNRPASATGEWLWAGVVTVLLMALGGMSQGVWKRLAQYHLRTVPAMVVRVYGQQWQWAFRYPGPDGRFDSADDIEVLGRALVPAGVPVRLELASRDVIHGFFVPALRLHQDVVPGFTSTLTVEITQPGTYEVRCTQFCGTDHHVMRGEIVATTPEAVDAWLKTIQENPFAH